jgi:hypothetical protein
MKLFKQTLILLAVILTALTASANESSNGPLHVLYIGPLGDYGSFRSSRTDYAYLPGQTLAPEGIYFDHLPDAGSLTDKFLKHFDAVVQVVPDEEMAESKKDLLIRFKSAGNGLIKISDGNRPVDKDLREAILSEVSSSAKSAWNTFLAIRPPLTRLPGEVPNYERRPEPIQFQAPLSPEDSMRYTQVPADFELQLFAAEPDVVKPIYMAWDERGRAWVVEARDYPHGLVPEDEPGKASLKICEDTDGDGRADKFTVFADGLNLATALVFVDGGVIVSEARHMLFLKDTNGDEKADVRQVLLPGWGAGDTHAMQSNLSRGFDNWIYGAVGYSNFQGKVDGKDQRFGQGIFRFSSDGTHLQFLHQ